MTRHHLPLQIRSRFTRAVSVAALAGVALVALAAPASACGGLVGENGTIQLVRTTTLAAYQDGIERYVTNFEFVGEGQEVGSIIPLPGVPTTVERGGEWTLQRLAREVAPVLKRSGIVESAAARDAEVLLETKIDALDITILRGGSDQVGRWALQHGFLLTPDAPKVLDFYSRRSQIFMAARFDASRAKALGQRQGDGTPIMLTIPTDDPWVPLRVLGLGLQPGQQVTADVFLLTPDQPILSAGARGLTLVRSERASSSLVSDLRSDQGMGWMSGRPWLSYLTLDVKAHNLDYDLAVSTHDGVRPSVRATGVRRPTLISPVVSPALLGF